MKKVILFLVPLLLAAASIHAALPQPDLIAQIHFAGTQKISADKHSGAFTTEFCSAEALAVRQQTANRLAPWLAAWLKANVGSSAQDGAVKLRPLLDDLQSAEWFLESRTAPDGKVEAALAIRLDAERAKLWQANLKSFFPAATFESSGGWLIFESGTAPVKLGGSAKARAALATTDYASVDISWPRLAKWFPKLKELALPETKLVLDPTDGNYEITGKLFFPESLALKLDPWRIPTNTIHVPFNSFTAVRGFAGWLQTQSWLQPYKITPTANQYCAWALPGSPYQTFAAIPFADAPGALSQAYARLQAVFSSPTLQSHLLNQITVVETNTGVSLRGTPFISPHLRAIKEPAGTFLLADAFPNTPRSQPLPPELFERLSEKNLVYYHWELTGDRFSKLLNFSQLVLTISGHRQLGGKTASMQWLQAVTPQLGHNMTTIVQTGPAEMTFTRKATGVLTAMELFTLGCWLEAPDFPGMNLQMPPRPAKFKRAQPFPLTTPVPKAK